MGIFTCTDGPFRAILKKSRGNRGVSERIMHDPNDLSDSIPFGLEAIVTPHSSFRRRFGQWAVLIVIVLTSLAFAVHPYAQTLHNPFAPAKTTAILLTSNLNWGNVLVDGIAVTAPSAPPLVLHLVQRKRPYVISLQSPPFLLQSCVLSIPVRLDDTCHPQNPQDVLNKGTQTISTQNVAAVVDFALTPNNLPNAEQLSILRVVDATLQARQARTIVPIGGHYLLTTNHTSRVLLANVTLNATLVTARMPTGSPPDICAAVCAGISFTNPAYPDRSHALWNIRVAAQEHWQFVQAADQVALGGTNESVSDDLLDLTLAYVGQTWSVPTNAASVQPASLVNLCTHGEASFETLTTTEPTITVQEGVALENHHLEGCRITTQAQKESSTQNYTITLLWRFGQLYVADALSAALLPDLPLASPGDLVALKCLHCPLTTENGNR